MKTGKKIYPIIFGICIIIMLILMFSCCSKQIDEFPRPLINDVNITCYGAGNFEAAWYDGEAWYSSCLFQDSMFIEFTVPRYDTMAVINFGYRTIIKVNNELLVDTTHNDIYSLFLLF